MLAETSVVVDDMLDDSDGLDNAGVLDERDVLVDDDVLEDTDVLEGTRALLTEDVREVDEAVKAVEEGVDEAIEDETDDNSGLLVVRDVDVSEGGVDD